MYSVVSGHQSSIYSIEFLQGFNNYFAAHVLICSRGLKDRYEAHW